MRTRNNKKLLLASTVHIPTTTHPTPDRWGWWGVPVVTAEGKRPDPSRTRKLSPPAPMVLRPTGRGRVGHRRNTQPPPPPSGGETDRRTAPRDVTEQDDPRRAGLRPEPCPFACPQEACHVVGSVGRCRQTRCRR